MIFHEVINEFQTTALDLAKNSKLLSCLTKNAFNISFVNEDAESVFRNICEKSREKAKKRNKKKSKTDKKSTEAVDLSEQECMSKRIMSSSRDHLDDSKSRNQIFKR